MSDYVSPLIAFVVISGAAGIVFLFFCIRIRGPEDTPAATVLRVLGTVYAHIVHRLRISLPEDDSVPAAGPAIIVANHRSGVDPVMVSIATRRRVRFLMAREYYEVWGIRWVFRTLGCIPVNRDGRDLGATKTALTALRSGHVIGIFPQGGIREADSSLEGKAGAALLALRTGAPVVPVRIEGSPNLPSVFRALVTPSQTTLTFGQPLLYKREKRHKGSREELQEVNAAILDAIGSLGGAPTPEVPFQNPSSTKAL
jgi:1-acyl-sn-glycerol-3-phosphate acyltransferase